LLNSSQPLTDGNIGNQMVQNKANQLAQNTAQMVQTGVLIKSDTVDQNSFVVGREVEDNGNVTNPRIQFVVSSAQDHLKTKLLGAKVLDKILVEEGKAKLELLEIYSISQAPTPSPDANPAAASAPEATNTDATASTDAASAPAEA